MKIFRYLVLVLCLPTFVYAAEEVQTQAMCQVPQRSLKVTCEAGGPFLCVNTPPGGVTPDFVILKGRLNLEQSTLGQLSVVTQHEYTKKLQNISLAQPLTENCWNQSLTQEKNFCLEESGAFAVRVPLPELGPYTIFVAASRAQGVSAQTTVRTSKVVAPTITPDAITYEPGTSHIRVILDLLKDCGEAKETCDFIGASTGGVLVSVDNQVTGPPAKTIHCETTAVQGAGGRFVVGVPAQPGPNQLTITVCNAATGFEKSGCPKITSPSFEVGGVLSAIEVLSTMPLRFKVAGLDPKVCDDSVKVSLNLDEAQKVCANSGGVYEATFELKEGYNIAQISAQIGNQRLVETVAIASGKLLTEEEWMLPKALQLWIPKDFLNKTWLARFHQYLNSEAFKTWLGKVTEGLGRGPIKKKEASPQAQLPFCPKGSGLGALRIKVMKPPQIGKIDLEPITFSENRLKTSVSAEDVSLAIQIYKDENGDGVPDIDPLPLKIGFKKLKLSPIFEQGRLSSPYTDCDYKRDGACYKMPALFVPSQFEGAASAAGAFAVCDTSQKVSAKMDEICHALNVVDRQTGGVIQERILDSLNSSYACQGTIALNNAFQNGIPFKREFSFFGVQGAVGVDELTIRETGLLLSLKSGFGEKSSLKGAQILLPGKSPSYLVLTPETDGISLGLSFPLVSQIFWGLKGVEGGEFSLGLDEAFFQKFGFDFATECEVKKEEAAKPSALCNIRPRAREILGPPISEFGYLDPLAPLRLVFSPSKAFPLRIDVLDSQGTILLEFADWELGIESNKGLIITAKLSLKLAAQVSSLTFEPTDPDNFYIQLKTLPAQSRWWVVEKSGTNTTTIPATSLLSTLEEKLKLAVDNFSQPGKEIKIKIPRAIDLPFPELGLQQLTWGPNGFELGWDSDSDRLLLQLNPILSN